jgi:hypothetical protein
MQLFRDFSFTLYYRQEILLVLLFFFHWLFDFFMQVDGDKKHKDNFTLLYHTFYYTMMMSIAYVILCSVLSIDMNPYFFGVTFVCHTVTDYFTSRWNAKTYAEDGPGKKLVNQIGFDQWLHHAQLFLTI